MLHIYIYIYDISRLKVNDKSGRVVKKKVLGGLDCLQHLVVEFQETESGGV